MAVNSRPDVDRRQHSAHARQSSGRVATAAESLAGRPLATVAGVLLGRRRGRGRGRTR